MSWRDQYRQGSFRGVPFRTQEMEGKTGRRIELHEFPQRDEPFPEDLGRRARQFTFDCFVAGDDCYAERDRLIDACEAEGAGSLVHPTRGQMRVVCLECEYSESGVDGGIVEFRLTFAEAGSQPDAPVAVDTGRQLTALTDKIDAQAPALFADRFDVAGMPDFVSRAAADIITGAVDIAAKVAAVQSGVGPALHAFEAGLKLLPTDAIALARAPLQLGRTLIGFIHGVSALGGNARRRIDAVSRLADYAENLPEVIGATAPRHVERANQAALQTLLLTGATAGLARIIADMDFASYDDAVALRDATADRLDRYALKIADQGDDAGAGAIDDMRRAIVRDVTARGGSLARIFRYEPLVSLPALVIAQRIYGDPARVIDRADEIVSRNRITHPGFVPVKPLELLGREARHG